MVEKVDIKRERLSDNELRLAGERIKANRDLRKRKRGQLESLWKEIDRQIAMEPIPRIPQSGTKPDWYPDFELPLQFNALEVIAADARRLKFPRGTEWFSTSAEVSDEYIQRWNGRRADSPLLSGSGFTLMDDSPLKALAQQVELDQETADVLVKVVMDHYHRQYDFRQQFDLYDAEMIKYGTAVARVRPVKTAKFSYDFRGQKAEGREGPAMIVSSIKNTYLDDTPHAVLHEGVMIAPEILRDGKQRLDDLLLAAKRGGRGRGWLPDQIDKLKPLDQERRHVDIIEAEGDIIIPQAARGSIFLPNHLVTVAVGQGMTSVIRIRENPVPFKSHVTGYYMRDDPSSAYGSSPLMKGQPIQAAATDVFNDLMAVSRLRALPPLAYDRNDPNLTKGPDFYPGAQFPSDAPNAVEAMEIGDLAGVTNAYLALLKQYEDLTGVNDARRGAPVRSHTTTGGIELEASRGIARTDDFVTSVEQGPLRTILYMEYEIIKKVMGDTQPVSVGTGGIEGWVNLNKQDLPDNVTFMVHGSAGVLNEREMAQNFLGAAQFHMQAAQMAAQLGVQPPIDFNQIIIEGYKRAGIQNGQKFIGAQQALPGAAPPAAGVPGAGNGIGANAAPGVVPGQAA